MNNGMSGWLIKAFDGLRIFFWNSNLFIFDDNCLIEKMIVWVGEIVIGIFNLISLSKED